MFVRIIKGSTKEYAVIVRGYRDKYGKVKQKTVQNLGPITSKNKKQLLELGHKLIAQTKGHVIIMSGEEIQEQSRHNWGALAIINSLWEKFSFDTILSSKASEIKLMLGDRLLDPSSKLRTYQRRNQYLGYEEIKLQAMYRALDLLYQRQDELKEHIFKKQRLYGKMDVVFFDVTTLYFESQKSDALKDFGYSKDCKFNEVQIVLSLVINSEGRPLTYEIFSGNTFEGHTLLPILDKLKRRFEIGKVIIVADRGMGSLANLDAIKTSGFDYIIGVRLRSAAKAVKAEAIAPDNFIDLGGSDEEDILRYKFIDNKQMKWVVLWSSKRARKDSADRQRLVDRAKEMLQSNMLQDKRGAKKYIQSSKSNHSLNLNKIEEDARFDGYYALSFSDEIMSAREIANAYQNLWRVEESFRTIKSIFEVRPIFHWTPKRISGHIMLNFISLVMENNLLLKLKEIIPDASHLKIRDAIFAMQKSVINIGGKPFDCYAETNPFQKKILEIANVKKPKNLPLL
jgi:transposase